MSFPSGEVHIFNLTDYVVFATVIAISVGIGVFHACVGGKQKTGLEYHLGNRKMQTLPLVLSMLVTTQSSILMLGIPTETYLYGGIMLFSSFGFLLSYLLGTRLVVPLLYPLKMTTVNEYYQLRYNGKAVRLFVAACMILLNAIYNGVVVMGQAVAMESVTRIPSWASIIAVSSAAVIYTSIGGIKAVIWTDVFQCFVMLVGICSVLIKGAVDSGGPAYVWKVNMETKRLNVFNFDPDPLVQYTSWSLIVGGTFKMFYTVVKQSAVQRMNSCQTEKQAKLVYLLSGPSFLLSISLGCGIGLVAFGYFTAKGCDPFKSKMVSNPNQLIPFMVVEIFHGYPGLSGLFLAAVASASLSSVSSGLASMSSITHNDFIKPHFPRLTDASMTRWSKLSVVLYGMIGILISFMAAWYPGSVFKVSANVMPVVIAPIVGIYLYSVFFSSATQTGAIVGGITSICLMSWINFGSAFYDKPKLFLQPAPTDQCTFVNSSFKNHTVLPPDDLRNAENSTFKRPEGLDALYSLSSFWFDAVGVICLLITAILTSFIVGRPNTSDVDTKYVFSFEERFCPCLPKRIRRVRCCGSKLGHKRHKWCENHKESTDLPIGDELSTLQQTQTLLG